MLAQFTITKAIHNTEDAKAGTPVVGMLAQFTITKAIHNNSESEDLGGFGWNASSIYNYESHSQRQRKLPPILQRLEC